VRRLAFIVSAGAIFLAAAPSAFACGTAGYSYAGISSRTTVYGVGATITALSAPAVQNGHVAGWVGVGGPGLGPHGSSEWIQVGYSGFPGLHVGSLYYEVATPGAAPRYHEISSSINIGSKHRLAVLEVGRHHNYWRVWVDGHAASPAFHLPGSHGAWKGIATAENWGGGMRACNEYSYRFDRVRVTHGAGGAWNRVAGVYPIRKGNNRLLLSASGSFTARTPHVALAPVVTKRPSPKTPVADARTAAAASQPAPAPTATPVTPPADPAAAATPAVDAAPAPAAPAPVDPAPAPVDPNAPPDDPLPGPGQ
jgi:hypothetical protein